MCYSKVKIVLISTLKGTYMELDKEKTYRLIKEVEATVEQMKIDDIENSPESAEDIFQCSCCGDSKVLAGSLVYGSYLFCNDCVLLTEVSLALNKIKYPEEMINIMEDKRFVNIYQSLFTADDNLNN